MTTHIALRVAAEGNSKAANKADQKRLARRQTIFLFVLSSLVEAHGVERCGLGLTSLVDVNQLTTPYTYIRNTNYPSLLVPYVTTQK